MKQEFRQVLMCLILLGERLRFMLGVHVSSFFVFANVHVFNVA